MSTTIQFPGPRLIGFRRVRVLMPLPGNPTTPFYSLIQHTSLPAGRMTARCDSEGKVIQIGFSRRGSGPRRMHGPVPDPDCRCGYYAFSRISHLRSQREYGAHALVPAAVLGWGRIITAEWGWRSEFQQLVAVAYPPGQPVFDQVPQIAAAYHIASFAEATPEGQDAALIRYLEEIPNAVWMANVEARYRHPRYNPAVDVEAGGCLCGCGRLPKGGRFLPGHDARLKGQLLRAARFGDTVERAAAVTRLIELGWSKFLKP